MTTHGTHSARRTKRTTAGRSRITDAEGVEMLAAFGCSLEEVAYMIGSSVAALSARRRKAFERGSLRARSAQRRLIWIAMQRGDADAVDAIRRLMFGEPIKAEVRDEPIN